MLKLSKIYSKSGLTSKPTIKGFGVEVPVLNARNANKLIAAINEELTKSVNGKLNTNELTEATQPVPQQNNEDLIRRLELLEINLTNQIAKLGKQTPMTKGVEEKATTPVLKLHKEDSYSVELEKKLKIVSEARHRSQSNLEDALGKVIDLEGEIKTITKEKEDLEALNGSLHCEVDQLRKDLAEASNSDKSQKLEEAQSVIKTLQTELDSAKAIAQEKEETANCEITFLLDDFKKLKEEKEAMQVRLNQLEAQAVFDSNRIVELTKKLQTSPVFDTSKEPTASEEPVEAKVVEVTETAETKEVEAEAAVEAQETPLEAPKEAVDIETQKAINQTELAHYFEHLDNLPRVQAFQAGSDATPIELCQDEVTIHSWLKPDTSYTFNEVYDDNSFSKELLRAILSNLRKYNFVTIQYDTEMKTTFIKLTKLGVEAQ